MLPFLHLHALAATRGDGLRPELRILLERLANASEIASNVAIADDPHVTQALASHPVMHRAALPRLFPSGEDRGSKRKGPSQTAR
jgi:hypothetical protein